MNFRLARDQVVLLDTAAIGKNINLWANNFFAVFFSFFELGGMTMN